MNTVNKKQVSDIRLEIEAIRKFLEGPTNISEDVQRYLKEYIDDQSKHVDDLECALQYKDLEGQYAKYIDDSLDYDNVSLMKIKKITPKDIYMDILVCKFNCYSTDEVHIYTNACRDMCVYNNISRFKVLTPEEFKREYDSLIDIDKYISDTPDTNKEN